MKDEASPRLRIGAGGGCLSPLVARTSGDTRASERLQPRSLSRPHRDSPLHAVLPSLVGADRAGVRPGPAPGLPQPLFAGPAALWLLNFILLSWSLPSWGHPLPSLPTQ